MPPSVRHVISLAFLLTLNLPGIESTRAQEAAVEMSFGSFEDAVAEAQRSRKPLVVFGMVDT